MSIEVVDLDPPFRRCAHHHHQRGQRKRETSVADPRICQHLRSRDQNLDTQPIVKDAELQESESRNLVDVDLRCLQCSCTLVGGKYHWASTWKTLDGNSLKLQLIGDPQRLGENLHARLKENGWREILRGSSEKNTLLNVKTLIERCDD